MDYGFILIIHITLEKYLSLNHKEMVKWFIETLIQCTLVNGAMENLMVKVYNNLKTEADIKDCLKMELKTDQVNSIGLMDQFMKVNLNKDLCKELDLKATQMEINLKVSL